MKYILLLSLTLVFSLSTFSAQNIWADDHEVESNTPATPDEPAVDGTSEEEIPVAKEDQPLWQKTIQEKY